MAFGSRLLIDGSGMERDVDLTAAITDDLLRSGIQMVQVWRGEADHSDEHILRCVWMNG